MKLYFFRHGHAEDAQLPDFDDFARNLTPKGIDRTQIAARVVTKLGIKPARLYSSPRTRARQTADILAEALGMSVIVKEEVNFGFNPQGVAALTADLDANAEVLFVGHEPDLSITIAALIGGGDIVMKKGGLVRVDIFALEPLKGALVWMIPPRIFEAL